MHSLTEALHAGYHVYDKHENGYLIRRRSPDHGLWELAVVIVSR